MLPKTMQCLWPAQPNALLAWLRDNEPEVMDRAGPQAVKDLWRAGLPMALAGWVATFFSPLSPDQRGLAAVFTLALGLLLVLGLIGKAIAGG